MSSVHLSPTRSSARASGHHWSYGWRLMGGTAEISDPPWADDRSLSPMTVLTVTRPRGKFSVAGCVVVYAQGLRSV